MEYYPIAYARSGWVIRISYLLFAGFVGYWFMYLPNQGGLEKEQQKQDAQLVAEAKPPFLIILNDTYRELLHEHMLNNSCMDQGGDSLKRLEICNQQHEVQSLQLQLARDKIERMYYFDTSFDEEGIDVLELFQEQVRKFNRTDSTSGATFSRPNGQLSVGSSFTSRP